MWSDIALWEWTALLLRASHEVFPVSERTVLHSGVRVISCFCAHMYSCVFMLKADKSFLTLPLLAGTGLSSLPYHWKTCELVVVTCQPKAGTLMDSSQMQPFWDSLSKATLFDWLSQLLVWFIYFGFSWAFIVVLHEGRNWELNILTPYWVLCCYWPCGWPPQVGVKAQWVKNNWMKLNTNAPNQMVLK